MPTHHPGTFVAHNNIDLTDVPWAVTTHLLSINHQQLLRATQHPFLKRAAKGKLPKSVIAKWLANDREYLQGYISIITHLTNVVRRTSRSNQPTNGEPNVEARLITWLESALENGKREIHFFHEVAEIYKIDIAASPLHNVLKSEGLRRYEVLIASVSSQVPNTFIPWLEGAVLLYATEKLYYEAWSYARRQDAQSSPRTFDHDEDGGAMRREFIPNWSNRDFLMFVEQLERILNEGVSDAVDRDDAKWADVKLRIDAIWQAVLDAEEAFWPDVSGTDNGLRETIVDAGRRNLNGSTLRGSTGDDVVFDENMGDVKWNGHIPILS